VVVSGELGAGKTRVIKGVCLGLGLKDPDEVVSPSFTLLEIHQGRCPIYHMDYYRLGSWDEVVNAGLDPLEYWDGVVLIEWGERFSEVLTNPHIRVNIQFLSEEERAIEILPDSDKIEGLFCGCTFQMEGSR
jgi:tRNA threonylcarbamoyladenosine biosynthesis protein TsaE